VSMTPLATVTVTGCAGAIPVVPNPGDAVTAATGAAGEAALLDAAAPLEAGGWAVPICSAPVGVGPRRDLMASLPGRPGCRQPRFSAVGSRRVLSISPIDISPVYGCFGEDRP